MKKKVKEQPEFKKLTECSFQALKRQCLNQYTDINLSAMSNHPVKNSQYIQVNYLKDFVYKISPQKHSKAPLLKQEQSFRDYLKEIQTDELRLREVNSQLKHQYFFKNNKSSILRQTQRKQQQIESSQDIKLKYAKKKDVRFFDPILYLESQNQRGQKKILIQKKRLNELHNFTDDLESVKYISQAPEIKAPQSLPLLNQPSTDSFSTQHIKNRQKTHHQISNSINDILEKSVKYQSQEKLNPKKLRSHKSRSQLQKETQRKIKTQRITIIRMMKNSQKEKSQKKASRNEAKSVDNIPAKQKYAIDFISYVRTKTKDNLDKYIYEKLIKQPERDLQRFQQFMLKEVKFQSQSNKINIERFFIKMREQFRKIQKYNKKGSRFDWRSKSLHLNELKNEDNKVINNRFLKEKKSINQLDRKYIISHSKKTMLENLEGKKLKSKADRIMEEYVRAKQQELEQNRHEFI